MTSRGVPRARRALLASGAFLAVVTVRPAIAQTVPVLENPGHATATSGAANVDVDLNNANQLIRWRTFSVGAGATVNFHTADTGATHYSVLNLVTTNQISQIDGLIKSGPNISVWLSNPAGIVFGGSGAFSGGSLVLTTSAMTADQARFDNTTPASLSGNVTLGAMPANTAAALTLSPGSSVTVTGGLLLAGQVVKVQGTIVAGGDVALIAAETATVPVDLFSPIAVTINKGATIGTASVGASGRITAAHVTIGAAAASGYDVLLSIDPAATLIATTAADGRIVLAAGRSSDEPDAGGTPRIMLAAAAGGSAADVAGTGRIALGGTITASDRIWIGSSADIVGAAGTITAGGTGTRALTVASGGALTLATALVTTHGWLTATAAGNATRSGDLKAGTAGDLANLSVAAGGALALGRTDGVMMELQASNDLSLSAGNGALVAAGPLRVRSGLAPGYGSIYLSQSGAGGIALAPATLTAGVDASGAATHGGDLFVQRAGGDITLGTVDSATFNLPLDATNTRSIAGTLTADSITTAGDLALRSTGAAIRVGQARSLAGGVTIAAATDVTGPPAGSGVANISAATPGKTVAITAGGLARLGTVVAGQDIVIDAAAVQGQGQGPIAAPAAGLRVGLVSAGGALTIAATGDARIGAVTDAGTIAVNATGSLTGLAVGEAIDLAPAGPSLKAGRDVKVGINGAQPAAVVLSSIDATGLIDVRGGTVQVGGIGQNSASGQATGATVSITAGTALSVDRIGTAGLPAQAVTATTDADTPTDGTGLLVDLTTGRLRAGYGFAVLDTTATGAGALAVTAGHAAQIGQATSGAITAALVGTQVAITADAIASQIAGGRNGATAITARAGDLYLGSPATAAASLPSANGAATAPLIAGGVGAVTIVKTGTVGIVRLNGSVASGNSNVANSGNITVQSATDIRAGVILSFGTIDLAARGTVGGLSAFDATAGDGLRVGNGETGGATTVTAAGDVRIGTLSGDTRLAINAGGSVTGLATGDVGAAVAATLVLAADVSVAVHGVGGTPLANATIAGVIGALPTDTIGPALSIAADRIAVSVLHVASATLAAGPGLSLDTYAIAGDLNLSTTAGGIAPVALFVPDIVNTADPATGVETLASGYGFANLVVKSAGGASSATMVAGQLAVTAGGIAQIGLASAGQGTELFSNADGSARNQIDIGAQAITLGTPPSAAAAGYGAYAVNGGLGLTARAGGLYLDHGEAGTTATLAKLGAASTASDGANELRVGSLKSGLQAGATGALRGDVSITSTTAVRANQVTSRTGDIRILADIGDITGLLLANAAPADGRVSLGYAGATLLAEGVAAGTTADPFRRITVSANVLGTVKIDTARAGLGGVYAPAAPAQITIIGGAIDAGALTTRNGDLTMTTNKGLLRLVTGDVARSATLMAGTAATADAQIGRLTTGANAVTGTGGVATAALYDIAVGASGAVTGLRAPTQGAAVAANGLRIATTITGRPDGAGAVTGAVRITGAGDVRLGDVTASGAPLAATSTGGSLTGLVAGDASPVAASGFVAGAAPTATGYTDLVATHGSITVGGVGGTMLGSAAIGRASAVSRSVTGVAVDGGSVTIAAGAVTAGLVEAAQNVTLTGASGLSADRVLTALVRDGALAATTTAANGTGAAGTGATGVTGVTYGGANLTALSLLSRTTPLAGTIIVSAQQVAELGTVTAGLATGPAYLDTTGSPGDQITLAANTIWLGSALAWNGNLNLLARTGDVTGLPFAATGPDATDGRLAVRRGRATLTSAVASGRIVVAAPAGTVQLGGVLAGNGVGAAAGNGSQIQITAANIDAGTALTTPIVGDDHVAALGERVTASNGSIALTAGGTVRLGIVSAPRGVSIGTPAALYGASITATGGDVTLTASGSVGGLLFPLLDSAHAALPVASDGLRVGLANPGVADLTATGDISIDAKGNVRLGTLATPDAITIGADGSITGLAIAAAALAGHQYLNVAASGNVLVGATVGATRLAIADLGQVSAGGSVTVGADRLALGTIVTAGAVSLTAGSGLAVDRIGSGGPVGSVTLVTDRAGADEDPGARLADTGSLDAATGTLSPAFGSAALSAGGAIVITGARNTAAGALGIAQLGTLTGATIAVKAQAIAIRRTDTTQDRAAITRSGDLTLTALNGGLYVESARAIGGAIMLAKGGSTGDIVRANEVRAGVLDAETALSIVSDTGIRAQSLTAHGAGITLTAKAGGVSGLATATPDADATIPGWGRTDLVADSTRAQVTVAASGLAQLGSIAAGASGIGDRTLNQIVVRAGQIDIATRRDATGTLVQSVLARGGNLVLVANAGDLRLGSASVAGGAEDYEGTTTLDGLRASGNIQVGALTTTTGDIRITAGSDVSGLTRLGAAATDGRLLPARERAMLAASAASRQVLVTAGGTVQLGAVTAGSGTGTAAGNQIQATATAIDIASAAAANASLALTATGGRLVLGSGTVAGSATLAKVGTAGGGGITIGTLTATAISAVSDTSITAVNLRATAGDLSLTSRSDSLTLGTGMASGNAMLIKQGSANKLAISGGLSAATVTLASSTDIDIGGAIVATAPGSGFVSIDNTGTNAVLLGAAATTSDASAFTLTADELNRLSAPIIVVNAEGRPLTIGAVAFGSVGANTQLDLLGTGAITLVGAVSGVGVARTLQIGGTQTSAPGSGLPVLAGSFTGRLDAGASLAWGGTVDLRAAKIVFGTGSLIGTASGLSDAQVASDLVARPASVLYAGTGTQGRYLSAATLQVRYQDYALFQNTGASAATPAGVLLGTGANLALDLYSGGNNAANSFALFGAINGQSGRDAVLLPVSQLGYAGAGTTRITLAASRINGCLIAAPGAGCLTVVQPSDPLSDDHEVFAVTNDSSVLVKFRLFDTVDNQSLTFEPLIATGNDALLGDVATLPPAGDVACPPGSIAPACPSPMDKGARP